MVHDDQVFERRDHAYRHRRIFRGDDGGAAHIVALGVEHDAQRAQSGADFGARGDIVLADAAGKDQHVEAVQLRDITVRELLPKRNYNPDEVADFYRRNFQLVDGAWLPAVQLMKEAWLKMENDPMAFLKEQGMLPSAPAAI